MFYNFNTEASNGNISHQYRYSKNSLLYKRLNYVVLQIENFYEDIIDHPISMEITKIEPAFVDERGSIWDLLTDENIHHIGFLVSKKGSIRGKHYHKEQKQYTLVLSGKVRIAVKNLVDSNAKLETHDLQKMEMVLFPPFHYHSIEALEDSECLVFTSKGRSGTGYEDDTFRIPDIETFKLNG